MTRTCGCRRGAPGCGRHWCHGVSPLVSAVGQCRWSTRGLAGRVGSCGSGCGVCLPRAWGRSDRHGCGTGRQATVARAALWCSMGVLGGQVGGAPSATTVPPRFPPFLMGGGGAAGIAVAPCPLPSGARLLGLPAVAGGRSDSGQRARWGSPLPLHLAGRGPSLLVLPRLVRICSASTRCFCCCVFWRRVGRATRTSVVVCRANRKQGKKACHPRDVLAPSRCRGPYSMVRPARGLYPRAAARVDHSAVSPADVLY